jgi:hypothetical protein
MHHYCIKFPVCGRGLFGSIPITSCRAMTDTLFTIQGGLCRSGRYQQGMFGSRSDISIGCFERMFRSDVRIDLFDRMFSWGAA